MAQPPEHKPDQHTKPRRSQHKPNSVGVRFQRLAKTHLAAGLTIHLIFLGIFGYLDIPLMVFINVLSVFVYGFCLLGLKQRKFSRAIRPLTWLEVTGHAVIATLALGTISGFHYYLVLLLPLLFIDPKITGKARVAGVSLVMTLFIGLDLTATQAGPWIPLDEATQTLLRTFNTLVGFLLLSSLVSFHAHASRKSEEALQKLADTDLLTGIRNRRSLIEEATGHTRRSGDRGQMAFILVDLDHFKRLNDRYGHAFGDKVLSETANLMNDLMRPGDILARWGGEEFLIMVSDVGTEAATRLAERLCAAIGDQVFDTGEGEIQITATLGVAQWHREEKMESCVSRADAALYRGKQNGRHRVETQHGN